MAEIKTILGNFLVQSNKSFPHDCELYDNLQTNTMLTMILGNIAGDKIILYGCGLSNAGARRESGYLFVRTDDFPAGEVLYFEGGNISAGMYVKEESVAVSLQNNDYPQAYTIRTMAAGTGGDNFSWDDFTELTTAREQAGQIEELKAEIAALAPAPLGMVQAWAGSAIPSGYALCDGAQYLISDYPELYAAIGTAFNSAPNQNGVAQTTSTGYFRLPDLRGRFVVGQSTSDSDYTKFGNAGGKKTVALTENEMPSHVHSVDDFYFIEGDVGKGKGLSGHVALSSQIFGSKGCDNNNDYLLYYTHDSASAGGGAAHENRPPYYTLAYIMRMK